MLNDENIKQLTRSKQRIVEHGEVFTPAWMVEAMLDLVEHESERIDSRILEPACGSGNFLVPALSRKFGTVAARHGRSEFEKRHYALFALMCVYGIELLEDNAEECRGNLAKLFNSFLGISAEDEWASAARVVLGVNIVCGDALTMTLRSGDPIDFAEWGYLGKGKFQRRDFRYDELTQRSAWEAEGSLFADSGANLFSPHAIYPLASMSDLARQEDAG